VFDEAMLRGLAIVLITGAALAPVAQAAPRNGLIYYVDGSSLWTVKPGGSKAELNEVFRYSNLAFAPRGRTLAATDQGGNGLTLLDAGDGSPRKDIRPSAQWSGRADWRPDGREIAFSECDRTIFTDIDECVQYGVYRIRPDGSHVKRVATGRGPDWSPDGRSIVFEHAMPQRRSTGNRCYGLYVVRRSGKGLRPILPRHPRCPVNWENPRLASFSPDGRRILFVHRTAIWTMRRDGSRARRIVRHVYARDVAWSPDGRRIAYSVEGGVYVASPTGRRPHRIAALSFPAGLAWQPLPSRR
jgi:Tol biopolymer transport system component